VCADLAATGIGVPGRVVACGMGTATLADGRTIQLPPAFVPATGNLPVRRGIPDPRRRPAPTHR
jgi:hypothetical protein